MEFPKNFIKGIYQYVSSKDDYIGLFLYYMGRINIICVLESMWQNIRVTPYTTFSRLVIIWHHKISIWIYIRNPRTHMMKFIYDTTKTHMTPLIYISYTELWLHSFFLAPVQVNMFWMYFFNPIPGDIVCFLFGLLCHIIYFMQRLYPHFIQKIVL